MKILMDTFEVMKYRSPVSLIVLYLSLGNLNKFQVNHCMSFINWQSSVYLASSHDSDGLTFV